MAQGRVGPLARPQLPDVGGRDRAEAARGDPGGDLAVGEFAAPPGGGGPEEPIQFRGQMRGGQLGDDVLLLYGAGPGAAWPAQCNRPRSQLQSCFVSPY
jgi:hypothetical protein